MPYRELARTHYRKDRHRLCRTVHTCSPTLAKQQENRRNKRSRMTNTYPPNEVGNIPTPADSFVQVPLSDTVSNLAVNTVHPKQQQCHTDIKTNIPKPAGLHFNGTYNIFRNLVIIFVTINQRFPLL